MLKVPDKRFLMYGIPRSGSTSLVSMLKRHPDIGLMDYEPFKKLPKEKSLDEKMRHLAFLDGFKIHVNQINEGSVEMALKKRKKVIFMDRRNIFKCALSLDRAAQSGVWQRIAKDVDKLKYDIPVNVNRVKKLIRFFSHRRDHALKILKREKIDYYHLFYEDFYLTSEEEKIRQLSEIFEFLGHKPVINQRMLNVMRITQLNDVRTYFQIPDIYKIEKKLGSDENGWLFNGGLQL